MNTIITYIEERIETLRKEKTWLASKNISEYICIMYAIGELQAVLNKIKETSWN